MKSPETTVKTKNSVLGTLLTVAATATITIIAMKKQKQIVAGINAGMTSAAALAQKMADGSLKPLTPDKQNGGRHAAPTT